LGGCDQKRRSVEAGKLSGAALRRGKTETERRANQARKKRRWGNTNRIPLPVRKRGTFRKVVTTRERPKTCQTEIQESSRGDREAFGTKLNTEGG